MDPCKLDAVQGIPEGLKAKVTYYDPDSLALTITANISQAFRILCDPDSLKSQHPARANILRENLAHELHTVYEFQTILRNVIARRIESANQESLSTPVTEDGSKSPYEEYAANLDGLLGKLNQMRGNMAPVLARFDPKATEMAAYWYKRFGTIDKSPWMKEATQFSHDNKQLLLPGIHDIRQRISTPYKTHMKILELFGDGEEKEDQPSSG
ncbi:MAG: hypothetical protein L6R37_007748 [Teloschistes peruensis]|nr:MAG: hypothetical protein L6R37_007748 [Teloschistes peruensis]